LDDISHMLLMLHAIFRMRMAQYIGILTSCVSVYKFFICAVFMGDTVVTGKVNCYNFIVPLRSFPRFAGTINQGYSSTVQCLRGFIYLSF